MQLVRVPTSAGVVHFHAGELRGDRPLIVMLQGATRALHHATPLTDRLTGFDIIIACLPGHNGAPSFANVTISSLARAYSEALDAKLHNRKLMFVGESIGGLIGLAIAESPPNCVSTVVALDPFLDGDVWPLRWMVENGHGTSVNKTFSGSYRHLVQNLRAPVHVIAGARVIGPNTEGPIPSLLLPGDRPAVAKHCRLSIVSGGHHLIQENPTACADIIRAEVSTIWNR